MEEYLGPYTLRIMLGLSILCFTALFVLACRMIGPK